MSSQGQTIETEKRSTGIEGHGLTSVGTDASTRALLDAVAARRAAGRTPTDDGVERILGISAVIIIAMILAGTALGLIGRL